MTNQLSVSVLSELIHHLSQFVSESRFNLLQSVVAQRTRYFTIVLEDIYQSQNASAVLRTCDCFGVQDVHIIENTNPFTVNPKVVLGSTKWLNINRYGKEENNTLRAIQHLKNSGYRIVATSPHMHKTTLNDFDISQGKFALLFGTELTGLSKLALDNADEYLYIPTVGFTESLNLSVTAAICIHSIYHKLHSSEIDYSLTQQDSLELLHHWLRLSVKSWRSIEKRFFKERLQ